MKRIITYKLFFLIVFILQLTISDAQVEVLPEVNAPSWVIKRPINSFKYIGIGTAAKNINSNYQNEAKKNALFDLSSEIKVDISTNSILYTVQNNNQFNENFNSLIKLSSADNIEGYRLVDTYENDKQYWLYYELDKQDYENIKQQKKKQIIARAVNLINASFIDEKQGNFTSSLKKRIRAFGILSPYLNEEVTFESSDNLKNIFDLTNTIQMQLQTISVATTTSSQQIKPYQPTYKPLVYKLATKNKTNLVDFPFVINCDNEAVKVFETTSSNVNGDIEVKIKSVKPLFQEVYFTLNPDIDKLMAGDSISKSAIILLKQFIETSQLKITVNVNPISVFISCIEKNNSQIIDQKIIEPIINSKFSLEEVRLVENKDQADYIIEVETNTFKDISSDILFKVYALQLAYLKVNLNIKSVALNQLIFKTEISDVYGYGNSMDVAGMNAYQSEKLKIKLLESLFFLKRKIIVY